MLKAVQLIKKFKYICTVEKSIRSKNTGNSMQVKGSCSVVLTLKT